ncbi:phosphoribosylanthranilate isomerase [Luteolibacter flavescens]|uniref:N-(5'-phosphoribosyl)anthranilate isomerase n=1 Tax=Luteolibacter flavescens TaxID=1859460 RepID=A0ABT3FJW1_9BACT|nr:phosphoribosylanthranilate isomerase [Luteolibacter flavescens]MCW1883581.1 phosphoribosylanthranilate isomerase [Luteolibacter flavescens]
MSPERFLSPDTTSLKICGVTLADDAMRLTALGVEALGANFWPHSKRYLAPERAAFLRELEGRILRVGVFVNADLKLPARLFREGYLDLIQLHGDETPDDVVRLKEAGIPVIKALGVRALADLERASDFQADGILLDAHAPGVYGGTGETIDWTLARRFVEENPALPVILAGGITPDNAAAAVSAVRPAALDIASGAEESPGVKDFGKVAALLAACGQ